MAGSPTEQEQAALEILLHESRRERIKLRVGRLGDSEVAFIVYVGDSVDAAETERDQIFPLAVVLDETYQKYVDVSESRLPTSAMRGAIEALDLGGSIGATPLGATDAPAVDHMLEAPGPPALAARRVVPRVRRSGQLLPGPWRADC